MTLYCNSCDCALSEVILWTYFKSEWILIRHPSLKIFTVFIWSHKTVFIRCLYCWWTATIHSESLEICENQIWNVFFFFFFSINQPHFGEIQPKISQQRTADVWNGLYRSERRTLWDVVLLLLLFLLLLWRRRSFRLDQSSRTVRWSALQLRKKTWKTSSKGDLLII